jgi:hypothetical protein
VPIAIGTSVQFRDKLCGACQKIGGVEKTGQFKAKKLTGKTENTNGDMLLITAGDKKRVPP